MQLGTRTVPFEWDPEAWGHALALRIAHRLNSALEHWLPEQRLFLRSGDNTRFVRLRPLTQAVAREASRRGITHLTGYMLGTNEAPARLLKAVGTVEYDKIEGGSRDMRVRLP